MDISVMVIRKCTSVWHCKRFNTLDFYNYIILITLISTLFKQDIAILNRTSFKWCEISIVRSL